METQTQARSGGEAENGEEEEQVGWEGQPSAAPMGAITATRHHSCTAVPAHEEWGSERGREEVGVSIRCVQITRYVWRA